MRYKNFDITRNQNTFEVYSNYVLVANYPSFKEAKEFADRNIQFPVNLKVLSLFDGISCGKLALECIGINPQLYFASDIDKSAIKISQDNWSDIFHLGDVTKIDTSQLPSIDLLIGGSPCQSFSIANNSKNLKGFDGKSGLFWEYVRILKEVKPKWFFLENVRMKKEWRDIISDALGVEPIEINSRIFSAQNRPRLYWTNIPILLPLPKESSLVVQDILEPNPQYLEKIPNYYMNYFGNVTRYSKIKSHWEKASCLLASMTKGGIPNYNKNSKGQIHQFTMTELERLQTLPEGYTKSVAKTNRYSAIGNCWTVEVIKYIFNGIWDR